MTKPHQFGSLHGKPVTLTEAAKGVQSKVLFIDRMRTKMEQMMVGGETNGRLGRNGRQVHGTPKNMTRQSLGMCPLSTPSSQRLGC